MRRTLWTTALAVAALLTAAGLAPAQTPTNSWTSAATDVWSTGGNWTPLGVPASNADTILEFDAGGVPGYTATNDLAGTFTLNGLVFNSGGPGLVVVAGNALSFVTSTTTTALPVLNQNGVGPALVTNSLTATNALTVGGTGTGAITFNGGTITPTAGWTVNNANFNVTVGAAEVLSGAGTLTKSGAGTLRMTGTGAWSGGINLTAGVIEIFGNGTTGDAAGLGTGAKTITLTNNATFRVLGSLFDPNGGTKVFSIGATGGTIDLPGTAALTLDASGQLTGTGVLTKTGSGTLLVGSSFTGFTGSVVLAGGITRITTNVGGFNGRPVAVNAGATFDIGVTSIVDNVTVTGAGVNGGGAVTSNGTAGSNTAASTITAATGLSLGGTTALGVNGPLAIAAGGITKVGSNVATITTTAAQAAITGPTAVQGGTLAISHATGTTPLLDASQAVTLSNAGTLAFTGNATTSVTQVVNGVTLALGQGTLSATGGTTGVMTLDTRGVGPGTATVAPGTQGAAQFTVGANGSIVVNNGNANGILGGWATFGAAAAANTWAVGNAGSSVTGLASYSTTYAAGNNVDFTATVTPGAALTFNSLRFSNASTTTQQTLNLSGTNTIQSGGILVQSTSGSTTTGETISGGAIVTGSAATPLYISTTNTGGTGDLTIGSVLGVTGTNVGFGVVKTQGGRVILTGTNLFTGGVTIGGGIVRATATNSLGATNSVTTFASGNPQLELFNDNTTSFNTNLVVASSVTPGATSANAILNVNRVGTAATGINITVNGTLAIGNQTFTINGGNSYSAIISGAVTLTGNPTINPTGAGLTLSGAITGAGFGVTKIGTNFLSLNSGASTFSGGLINGGISSLRLGASSTVSGGVVTQGPAGTGTITANGGNFNDGDAARTIHNKLVIVANTTFQNSTLGSAGTFTFTSALLATPNTIDLLALNPTITVGNVTTFASVVTGASFTKAGTGTLVLSADNTTTGYTGTATVSGGVLQFGLFSSIGGVGRSVTAASGGTVATTYALDQATVNRIATASAGVVALTADSAVNFDFTPFATLRLGAAGTATPINYTGTPNFGAGANYRFGGGGQASSPVVNSALNVGTLLTGAVAVDVGANGGVAGDVILANAGNTFTGAGGFNVLVQAGGVLRIGLADGNPGDAASYLGAVPAAATTNVQLNGGTIRYGAAAATVATTRVIAIGAGGGTVDTNGFTVTMPNTFTGTGAFAKAGTGALTLPVALPAVTAAVVNGATTAAASVLNLGGNPLTATSLTVTGVVNFNNLTPATPLYTPNLAAPLAAVPTTFYSALVNTGNLAVTGVVSVGADSPALVLTAAGSTVNVAAGANDVRIGFKTTAGTTSVQYPGVFDARLSTSLAFGGTNIAIGGTAGNTLAIEGLQSGRLLLPAAAGTTASLAATGFIQVGGGTNNGGTTGRIVLGAGTATVTAPLLYLGAQKASGFVAFFDNTGSLPSNNNALAAQVYNVGGTLSLAGVGTNGRVNIDAGRNTSPGTASGTATGTIPLSAFDTTGGTLTGPGGFAQIGSVQLGLFNPGGTASLGGGIGVFVVNGPGSGADINGVTLAAASGTVAANVSTPANTKGIFVVNDGTVRLNGAVAVANGTGAGVAVVGESRVDVFGGTLNMQTNNLGSSAFPLNGTTANNGVSAAGGLNLIGGTILNAAVIGTTNFNHAGGTLSRTTPGITGITGPYNLGVATAPVGNYGYGVTAFAAVGGSTILVDGTGGGTSIQAPSLNRTGTGTLNVIPVTGSLGNFESVVFNTPPTQQTTSTATPLFPVYAVAQANGTTNTAGDFLTHGSNLVPITYSTQTDLNAATGADVFNATTPQLLAAAVNPLALRVQATTVDANGYSLVIGSGANPAGLILNAGAAVGNGTVAFGTNTGHIYAGFGTAGSAANVISANISGSAGLVVFGSRATGTLAAGTVQVNSNNTGLLTGAVTINGGVLSVNNAAGSATGTGAVTVGSSGTLGGGAATAAGSFVGTTGFVTGAVAVNRFGTVAPGNSVGTVTTGAATLAGGAILSFELDPTTATPRPGASPADVNVNDRWNVTGALTLSAATNYNPITLNVNGGGGAYGGGPTYDFYLTNSTSVVGFNAAAVTIVPTNFASTGTFTLNQVGNNLVLTYQPVPEPATVLALCGGAAAVFGLASRLRRKTV